MARKPANKKPIEQYDHKDKKRLNNPPVGLVTPDTDKDTGQKKEYQYDPHLDPQLVWAGKAEHTSFEVPTVSLHVHERMDPKTIIEAVRKRNGQQPQLFFQFPEENPPLRDAIQFYKHAHNWSNRLIAGDSLLVMNSLLEKEGMAGQVQMVYIDPPYGIKYGSNFQPFVNKRDVKDGKDEDLTAEPEMIKAFRDTWELGIHSYLAYLRDRLLLAKELLTESGSCFVQIGDENVHLVRNIMDEVFGTENLVSLVPFRKTSGLGALYLRNICDYLAWYAKSKDKVKYHQLFLGKPGGEGSMYTMVETPDGTRRKMVAEEKKDLDLLPSGSRVFRLTDLVSSGTTLTCMYDFEFEGRSFQPGRGKSWRTNIEGMRRLVSERRLMAPGNTLQFVTYLDDFPVKELTNLWDGLGGETDKQYVVQTATEVVQRCLLMSTDPGDLVFDPTCGSGTTAYVAEQWGRRWITCDTSRVALTLAKQRLMTPVFDYYELAHPSEGVGSGFNYKTVPHITLKSIANNEPPAQEALYDQPFIDNSKARVTGPFTVEAVPAQAVKPLDDIEDHPANDESIARSGETLRQGEWRDELFKTGIRGKGGQRINFSRVEPMGGTRWLHADAETKGDKPERVVASFGPEHQPLEQRQVALALEEAQLLVPKPKIVVFAAFQFDPEAAKDIDETDWPGVTLLKAQMNADLLTDDLKKKRSSNESFWLFGQPDIKLEKITEGEDAGKYKVEVLGFDYYNTITGNIDSGGTEKIAMWMLDTDYDGRSVYPRQVFFPMATEDKGWSRLTKNLKAEIDEELIEAYRGTVSLPFEPGDNKRVAVKIIDDRGIESLRIMEVD
ncbi:MAG TPA: site-specific DNA-methyltransferase [Sedimentisphaerales bacterium]|nr:site-specific DNA-methyltransferase [Sedimentisphaerales bacterium]